MSFISLEFILLFLLCFTLYHFVSDKGQKFVLLASSGVFIGYFNPVFLLTALAVSLFTYGAAVLVEQARGKKVLVWFTGAAYPVLSSAGLVSGMPTG